jgi:hypothetical protein
MDAAAGESMRQSAWRCALAAATVAAGVRPAVIRAQASVTVQNVVVVTIPPHPARMVAPPVPAARAFEHSESIVTRYDETRDLTTVSLAPMRVAPAMTVGASFFVRGPLGAGADSSGTAPARPFFVRIAVAVDPAVWAATREADFVLAFPDGTEMACGPSAPGLRSTGPDGAGVLLVDLSVQMFLRVAAASSVAGRLGTERFRFSGEEMEAVREVAWRAAGRKGERITNNE